MNLVAEVTVLQQLIDIVLLGDVARSFNCSPHTQSLVACQLWEKYVLLRDDADCSARWFINVAYELDGAAGPPK